MGLPDFNDLSDFSESTFIYSTPEEEEGKEGDSYVLQLGNKLHQASPSSSGRRLLITGDRRQVAVTGLGGIGKSTLALYYAHLAKSHKLYDVICWIEAEVTDLISTSYQRVIRELGINIKDPTDEGLVSTLNHYLKDKKFLFLYDNVVDLDTIQNFIPKGEKSHIIITSRKSQWPSATSVLELGTFRREESIRYLFKAINRDKEIIPPTEENSYLTGRVAKKLGDFPLALSQAASYIFMKSCGFERYLEELKRSNPALFKAGSRDSKKADIKKAVYTTWDTTLRSLSPLAQLLMTECSYLAADMIPIDLLKQAHGQNQEIEEAIDSLKSYSMIKRGGQEGQYLFIHRMVQWVGRLKQEETPQDESQGADRDKAKNVLETLTRGSVATLERLFQLDLSTGEGQDQALHYLPHLVTLYRYSTKLTSQDATLWGPLRCMGRLLCLMGEHVSRSYTSSAKKDAAKQGMSLQIQKMIAKGQGLFKQEREEENTLRWLDKVAESSCGFVQFLVGELYMQGHGVWKNVPKGMAWHLRSIEREESVLHRAIKEKVSEETLAYLIRDVFLESENDHYETPLDVAMAHDNSPAFFALIKAGAGKRLHNVQAAEAFYKKFALSGVPEFIQYQQPFETLRGRSALINGIFIRHHFFQESTRSPLQLAGYGPQEMPQEAWDQLFDEKGTLKPIDPKATRKVGLVDLKGNTPGSDVDGARGLGLFFKQYPALPGIETAVDVLTQLLFYRGVPYTALANIKGVPYLISEGKGREEALLSASNKNSKGEGSLKRPSKKSTAKSVRSSSSTKLSKASKDCAPQLPVAHSAFEHYQKNNLAYVLKHIPERLEDIDEESLSEAIIMAILTGQEDGKPNNFMLDLIPDKPGKFQIVPIDNDQAFVPEASDLSPHSRQKGKPSRVQVKSVLFCLNQMKNPIHPSVVEVLVNLIPEKLVQQWLKTLEGVVQKHQALFTDDQMADFWKKHETYIGVPFQKGDIQGVYFKLMKIGDLLKFKPTLTHLELLKEVLPFVHHRYNEVFTDETLFGKSIHERFVAIDGDAYVLKKGSDHHITLSSSSNILETKKIHVRQSRKKTIGASEELLPSQWQGELTQAKQAYEDEAKQLLIRKGGTEIAAIMSGQRFKELKLDLSRRSPYEQDLLFDALDISNLQKLSLTHSSELKDSFFERGFSALRKLDIRGCLQLTNELFALLMKSCPNLRSLNLAKNTALTKIAILKTFSKDMPLLFKKLRILNISGCSALQQVRLHAPKLQYFLANDCSALSEIQLTGAMPLKTLDLRNPQSLSLSTFDALIQGHQATLTQVQTEGAKNLPTIPKIPFQDIKYPFEEDNLNKFNDNLKRATENDDPASQYKLADMYALGQGVKQNLRTAIEWYRKAAEKGHEAANALCEVCERFLKGKLIYKPNEESGVGRIELRIADLPNPLEGEFDLSKCGDTGKYLSINTGYRKGKRRKNKERLEIWLSPHFLIEKNLQGDAMHFKGIMDSWAPRTAPVGIFWTWGDWENMGWYDYLTTRSFDELSDGKNLLTLFQISPQPPPRPRTTSAFTHYHMRNDSSISYILDGLLPASRLSIVAQGGFCISFLSSDE